MIDTYIECAKICSQTDYENKQSVKRHNKAVNKMYEIIEVALKNGTIQDLYQLLENENCSKWLAHQVIEKTLPPEEIKEKCFSIVTVLAEDNLGEKMWLKEWKGKV